jgi:DNA-binding response OmpR family regulator
MTAAANAANRSQNEDALRKDLPRPVVALLAGAETEKVVLPALWKEGYAVECLRDHAMPAGEERRPSIFLLEYGLKNPDTLSFCRAIRGDATYASAAVLFLARNLREADRVLALEAGADACVAMPLTARELDVQIKAVVRSYGRRHEHESLVVGKIEIDVRAMLAKVAGRRVSLSLSEFRLLEFLCRKRGCAVSRDELLQIISKNARVGRRAVDVYIRRLRKKIEDDPARPAYLNTIRGVGYRLDHSAS